MFAGLGFGGLGLYAYGSALQDYRGSRLLLSGFSSVGVWFGTW